MRFHRSTARRAALLASMAAAVATAARDAEATIWTGNFSGDFMSSINWDNGLGPSPTIPASFISGAFCPNTFVNLSSNQTVLSMSVQKSAINAVYKFTETNNSLLTLTNGLSIGTVSSVVNPVTFDGFRLNAASVSIGDGSTLQLLNSANVVASGATTLSGNGSLTVATSSFSSGSVAATGTSLVAVGFNGLLTSSNIRVDTGATLGVVNSGSISLNAGGSLNANGGTVQFDREYVLPGAASMMVQAGGNVSSSQYMDVGAVGASTLTVTGSGSNITVGSASSPETDWGNGGAGSATVTFSSSATGNYNGGLDIANGSGTARVNINTNASVTAGRFLRVGGGTGAASVTINSAGLISSGPATFGNNANIAISSGSLAFNDNVSFLAGSTLNWSGGAVNVAAGKTLNVTGGTINHTGGGVGLGNGATVRVTSGGKFDNNSFFDIANGNSSGTLLVDGAGSRFTSGTTFSDWGKSTGNSATVTFSNNAVGTYSAGLEVSSSGGKALVNLTGGATLNASYIKVGSASPGSSATINVAGGGLISSGTSLFQNGATVTLSSGNSLNLGGNATFSTGSTLNLTGVGNPIVTAPGTTLTIDGGVVAATATGQQQSVDTTTKVVNGGVVDIASYDVLTTGTLLVDGPGSRFTSGRCQFGGGNGATAGSTITFSNSSVGTISILQLGFLFGRGTLNVNSGAQLVAGGSLLLGGGTPTGSAVMNIADATVRSTGLSRFLGGAKVNVTGTGALSLEGDSTFSTGSTLNLTTGGHLNLPTANTTLAFDGGVGTVATDLAINGGRTFRITNGGQLTANFLDLYGGGGGTLLVDGTGSKLNITGTSPNTVWGQDGPATVTFSNGAVGNVGDAALVGDVSASQYNILSNAQLNFASLFAGSALANSSISSTININGGTLNVSGEFDPRSGATVNVQAGGLTVGGLMTMAGSPKVLLTSGGNKVLRAGGLTMFDTSKIDLADNDMIVGSLSTSTSDVTGFIRSARNNGAWNGGSGVTSSTAASNPQHSTTLGVITGAQFKSVGGRTTFEGIPVADSDVLVKYTYYGDTDFNGKVNFDDYVRTDSGFNNHLSGWFNGDFDLNGQVNFDDYVLIDLAFNTQSGTLDRALSFLDGSNRSSEGMSDPALRRIEDHFEHFGGEYAGHFLAAVPEPTAIALASMAFALLPQRRRRP